MLKILTRRSILLFAIVLLQLLLSSCGNSAPPNSQGRSGGSGGTGGTTPLAFMYGASNTITGLSVNSDNSFTSIPNSTFTLPNGNAALSIATVLNKFVYVIDAVGTIAGYSITSPTGALVPFTFNLPTLPSGTEFAVDPLGRYLFAVTTNSVLTFTINSFTGALVQNSTALPLPIAFATGMGLGVDSQGKLLVISNGNEAVSLKIASDGSLTTTTPISTHVLRLAIDSQSRFVYGVDRVSANLYGLAIGSNGQLSPLAPFPIQTNAANRAIIVRPGTFFVYVGQANDIVGFQESFLTGALTPVPQNPSLTNRLTADELAYDARGRFLFANSNSASVLTDDKLTGVLTLNPNQVSNVQALLNAIITASN
jgi:hypothetical protein